MPSLSFNRGSFLVASYSTYPQHFELQIWLPNTQWNQSQDSAILSLQLVKASWLNSTLCFLPRGREEILGEDKCNIKAEVAAGSSCPAVSLVSQFASQMYIWANWMLVQSRGHSINEALAISTRSRFNIASPFFIMPYTWLCRIGN